MTHRVRLGGLVNQERSTVGLIRNRYGTFTCSSLEDFEAGRPFLRGAFSGRVPAGI